MKNLIIEYCGYKLKVEITPITDCPIKHPHIKGTCESISFTKTAYYGDYQTIIDTFMKNVDREYEEEARNETLALLD